MVSRMYTIDFIDTIQNKDEDNSLKTLNDKKPSSCNSNYICYRSKWILKKSKYLYNS